ncbi:hypothetical protein THUN1379_17720 [Paludibacterium sp. THUN1379]|nr:hypothetical protein THUN1379_17720 [Paludibacterium sp. THUN1379]
MSYSLATEIVFEELRRSYINLMESRRFPAKFRKHFEEYVYKSHQLTEVMRREYKAIAGLPWLASEFKGWNIYTASLKSIRNSVVHGIPLVLHEKILAVYPAVDFACENNILSQKMRAARVRLKKATCFVDLPFQDEIITPHIGYPVDGGGYVFPLKEFVSYELPWNLLKDADLHAPEDYSAVNDVVRLVLRSYPALHRYYDYYQSKLNRVQESSLKQG